VVLGYSKDFYDMQRAAAILQVLVGLGMMVSSFWYCITILNFVFLIPFIIGELNIIAGSNVYSYVTHYYKPVPIPVPRPVVLVDPNRGDVRWQR
jgi:hypothetical protein